MRRSAVLALAAAAVLMLAACSSSGGVTPTATHSSSSPAQSTPTPTPTPTVRLADSWSNNEEYSYEVTLEPTAVSVTTDVADAKPGYAILEVSYGFTGLLKSTTVGHNAPYPDLIAVPLWVAGSPACSVSNVADINTYTAATGPGVPQVCEIGATAFGGIPMVLPTGPDSKSTVIPPGGVFDVGVSYGFKLTVTEGDAATLTTVFEQPSVYAIARDEGPLGTRCLAMNGFWVSVATGPTGCTPA